MTRKFIRIVMGLLLLGGIILVLKSGIELNEIKAEEKKTLIEVTELLEKPKIEKKEFTEPQFGESVGNLVIPQIEAMLPIVEGTHEDDLRKGVGHYGGTAYPQENDQIFLSGHRDTVFRRMGELEIGDILTMSMPYGDFEYQIVSTKIVDAEDRSVIVPHDEEVLTISTCYPFNFVGHAPDRYIINAKPIYESSSK